MNENARTLQYIHHLQMPSKPNGESFYQFIPSLGDARNPCAVFLPRKFNAVHHQTILVKDFSICSVRIVCSDKLQFHNCIFKNPLPLETGGVGFDVAGVKRSAFS